MNPGFLERGGVSKILPTSRSGVAAVATIWASKLWVTWSHRCNVIGINIYTALWPVNMQTKRLCLIKMGSTEEPGRWHNGAFVFCSCDCTFEAEPSPTSTHACREVTGCTPATKRFGKCSTRGESWGMYITFASTKIVNKAEPTLALKPRGDVTRNPKQGYQWPKKRTCVRQKL